MERLPHGFANHTRHVEGRVEKRYVGINSSARAEQELIALTGLFGRYPVPEVLEFEASVPMLVLAHVYGAHGQELMEAGRAAEVLLTIGTQLSFLQSFDSSSIPGLIGTGEVIVHGDFGPQNMLLEPVPLAVSAVLDWERAHVGSAVEDPAWAEWIVRTHHPDAIDHLPRLFAGLGRSFSWADRQAAMVRQCSDYIDFCEASGFEAGAVEWKKRTLATEGWSE
jgi:Phosphotransferase enzyme family